MKLPNDLDSIPAGGGMIAGLNALLNKTLNYGRDGTGMGGIGRLPARSGAVSRLEGRVASTVSDEVLLSEPLKALRDSGVDLEGSSFIEERQLLSFNLHFQDEQVGNFTSTGYYDLRSQLLQVDFSFQSSLIVKDAATGEERQELFQFDFHLEASRTQAAWGNQRVEKEDILQFARKIFAKILKLHSEGKEIDGLVLDSEDLKDLGSVDDGRLLKSIMQIIQILRNLDRLRGNNGDHTWLTQAREKALIAEEGEKEEQNSSMSLRVRRVSAEVNRTGSSEALQTEDTAAQSNPEQRQLTADTEESV
jgi:hypothetical protein